MEVEGDGTADAISKQLLNRPAPQEMQKYYAEISRVGLGPGLQVRGIDGDMGKGVFADRDFNSEELVLREAPLVGAQHSRNKRDAMVCSHCFRYVGSIELQLARRLLQNDGSLSEGAFDRIVTRSIGQLEAKLEKDIFGSKFRVTLSATDGNASDDVMDSDEKLSTSMDNEERDEVGEDMDENDEHCGCSGDSKKKKALPSDARTALASGTLVLPYSNQFPLPHVVTCKGGCLDDVYCSDTCAGAAWAAHHSLLCTGPSSHCKNTNALVSFKEFADETNDVFHIAAQVIAGTLLKARKLESTIRGKHESTLLRAWEPFAMGFKLLWWETVALPSDVDLVDERQFRDQMKEIAAQSLSLLKSAIYEDSYAPCFLVFSLEVYGHIIGMFELNNLEIVVASPVEDYFLYIEDLPPASKAEAEVYTKPFLDALGDDYAAYCQGSGFYSLQSCMNHSCRPNAKAFKRDEDRDGHAVLLATRPIRKGEEVTISYIDEDASLEERRAGLADYAFVCRCSRCLEES